MHTELLQMLQLLFWFLGVVRSVIYYNVYFFFLGVKNFGKKNFSDFFNTLQSLDITFGYMVI